MKLRDHIDRELAGMTPDESILRDILKKENKPFFLKPGLALCTALLALAFVIPVSANMFGPIGNTIRITDENRALLKQPDIAVSEEAPADTENHAAPAGIEGGEAPSLLMDDLDKVSQITDGIIQEIEEGALLPDTLTNIALTFDSEKNAWMIPELLTANGFVTIFTKEDGGGWNLSAGEELKIFCSVGDTAGNDKGTSSKTMEFGYIENHVFREGKVMQKQNFSYTLTAPEDGVYYPYCINCSAGKIYITGGEVR